MKQRIFLLFAGIFFLPLIIKAQDQTKERQILDSIEITLNKIEKNNFIYGVKEPPKAQGNGEYGFQKAKGEGLNKCLCNCYCAIRTKTSGLTFFRPEKLTDVSGNNNSGTLILATTSGSFTMEIKNQETLQKVKNWFVELKKLCANK